jgi:hypothetical protein
MNTATSTLGTAHMADLSRAAQAVLDAYNAGFIRPVAVHHKPRIAAALRAVVQELKYFGITEKNILAIAAELEGNIE